jgi:hypothetical protein
VTTRAATVPRRRSLFRRVAVPVAALAVSALVAVGLLEVALRSFNLFGVNHGRNELKYRAEALDLTALGADGGRDLDGTLFRHKPSKTVDLGEFTLTTNSLGFRGPDVAREKAPGTYRILVLGDSVVFGWGIPDEDTFVRRLERDLNAKGDGRRYEVLNTGHPVYDSTQEAALLEREGLPLAPDLVLLVYVINDIEPTRDLIEALLDQGTAVAGAPPPGLGDRARLFGQRWLPACTALWTAVRGRLSARAQRGGEVAIEPDAIRNGKVGWERSQTALLRMRDLCAARGIPFLVLDHTLPRLSVLGEFCAREGIRLRDLRFTPDELAQPIFNSVIDTHANARGSELLVEKLKRALREEGVLDVR